MTTKSVRDKIEPYLLSFEKTAAFGAVRLTGIQQSKTFRIRLEQKTLELSGSGGDPSKAADIVTENFERDLDRSRELFEKGKLPLEAFVAGYRKNTDSKAWPSVILEVKASCEMDQAAAVLEAEGFYLAENPFWEDSGVTDKFRIFRYLHLHIPPDQTFLAHIAGLDFADYLFDAERVISLPDPIGPPAKEDVAPELSDGRNLIFPGGMWSADWPENLGADVKIGIIDSGIDAAHPDFESRIAAARDFTDEGDGLDRCGHGTHVAGIAAGSGAASEGRFMGISRNSRLIDAKIFGKDGTSSNQLILAGMRWAYDRGARVMNMSLGSNGTRTDGKSLLSRACDVLAERGVVVCVSAGNSGPSPGTISSPGDAGNALTVGAVDRFKKLADFSSRGPTDEPHATGHKPDVVAPGVEVMAPRSGQCDFTSVPEHPQYTTLSGTSMAAPMVTGLCALLISFGRLRGKEMIPGEVKALLEKTSERLGYDRSEQGSGLVNGTLAMERVNSATETVPADSGEDRALSGNPARLGKYEILSEIGRGGYGTVYKARDVFLDEVRAIKTIPLNGVSDLESLLKEARIQVKLNHSNIVRVFEADVIEEKLVIAMEWVDGISLGQQIRREGKMSPESALRVFEEVCSGLQYAHEARVIHHDVKPDNILITRDGQVKITDFGIARIMEQGKDRTATIVGTVKYMSPEQLKGEIDRRSDIWAAGAVLFEMLTGQAAFSGESRTAVIRSIETEEPAWDRLDADVPDEVSGVLRGMLAKDKKDRHGDFSEVLKMCSSESLPPTERLVVEQKRGRLLKWALVVVAAVALGVFYSGWSGVNLGIDFSFWRIWAEPDVPGVPLPDNFLSSSDPVKLKLAESYVQERKSDLAYHALHHLANMARDPAVREKAAYLEGALLANVLGLPYQAKDRLENFIRTYPRGPDTAGALYTLGMLRIDQKEYQKAMDAFSTLFQRFPDSPKRAEAGFLLQKVSRMMEGPKAREGRSLKETLGSLLPNNGTSLVLVLMGALVLAKVFWIGIGQVDKVDVKDLKRGKNARAIARVMHFLIRDYTRRNLLLLFILTEFTAFFLNWYIGKMSEESLLNQIRELMIASRGQG